MVYSAKKRILFVLGLFVTGLIGILGGYGRSHYSKKDSLLVVPTAHADLQIYNWVDPSACGDGCGDGCCGGCSSDGDSGG